LRPTIHQLGTAVALVSVSTFFGALIIAYAFRIQAQPVWEPFEVPSLLWVSTVVLGVSSWTLEAGRYALRRAFVPIYRGRLLASLALGLIFIGSQAVSGAQLLAQGVAAPGNPHGSAFYVFMTLHGVHLFGGMLWLSYLYRKSAELFNGPENDLRKHRVVASAAAMYWHFMGALWLVLFILLEWWSRARPV
jgi:cytochrome c oxidase subunit 3